MAAANHAVQRPPGAHFYRNSNKGGNYQRDATRGLQRILPPWLRVRGGEEGARVRTGIKMLQVTDQSEEDVRNVE